MKCYGQDWETGLHCTHHNRKVGQKIPPARFVNLHKQKFSQDDMVFSGFLLYPVIDRGRKKDRIFYPRFSSKYMDACFFEGYPVSVNKPIWAPIFRKTVMPMQK